MWQTVDDLLDGGCKCRSGQRGGAGGCPRLATPTRAAGETCETSLPSHLPLTPLLHRKQEVGDFLDEDEKAEAGKAAVRIAPGLDTFGAAASTAARDAAEAEAAARFQEALPGLLPAELLAPVAESLGGLQTSVIRQQNPGSVKGTTASGPHKTHGHEGGSGARTAGLAVT